MGGDDIRERDALAADRYGIDPLQRVPLNELRNRTLDFQARINWCSARIPVENRRTESADGRPPHSPTATNAAESPPIACSCGPR
ncbi:hypothetical protein AAFF_G00341710 [Aldrovandia affinis]|uniref:Uncharacterized protein n=1 Tax=Aldrovandia affinis TaxID=143900 RepID=A0AAD7WPN8_9TELE|nr:hypothetical protein AAFF_G00341710 [Aldrovandia affinis]